MTLFFELIQVTLGQRSELSRIPSEEEWKLLQDEAKRQALMGILFSGIEQLPAHQRPSEDLLFGWFSYVNRLEKRNAMMDARCLKLLRKFEEVGLRATILKGQGLAMLYGDMRRRRQCGDIDVYVDGGLEHALCKMPKAKMKNWGYKHVELVLWDDTDVEMHYRVEYLSSLRRNRRLQKWFESHKEELFHRDGEWVTPTLEMNLFYILLHIYRHFLWQGVGLRQIVDYYFCLKAQNENRTPNSSPKLGEVLQRGGGVCSQFSISPGMDRFARGLMWVMGEVLAMPANWMPWPPDEKEGRFILEQVLSGGNFGDYAEKLVPVTSRWGKMHRTLRHALHLFCHYPAEALAAPVWAVYNRVWKLVYWSKLKIHYVISRK